MKIEIFLSMEISTRPGLYHLKDDATPEELAQAVETSIRNSETSLTDLLGVYEYDVYAFPAVEEMSDIPNLPKLSDTIARGQHFVKMFGIGRAGLSRLFADLGVNNPVSAHHPKSDSDKQTAAVCDDKVLTEAGFIMRIEGIGFMHIADTKYMNRQNCRITIGNAAATVEFYDNEKAIWILEDIADFETVWSRLDKQGRYIYGDTLQPLPLHHETIARIKNG